MKGNMRTIWRSRFPLAACLLFASFASHAAAPAGRYTINAGAGIVTDSVTGLVWQRTVTTGDTWVNANSYCQGLNLGGWSSGWRLPTIKELQSIVDVRSTAPAIDTTAFPSTLWDAPYWSSSVCVNDSALQWLEEFTDGVTRQPLSYGSTGWIRCVR